MKPDKMIEKLEQERKMFVEREVGGRRRKVIILVLILVIHASIPPVLEFFEVISKELSQEWFGLGVIAMVLGSLTLGGLYNKAYNAAWRKFPKRTLLYRVQQRHDMEKNGNISYIDIGKKRKKGQQKKW